MGDRNMKGHTPPPLMVKPDPDPLWGSLSAQGHGSVSGPKKETDVSTLETGSSSLLDGQRPSSNGLLCVFKGELGTEANADSERFELQSESDRYDSESCESRQTYNYLYFDSNSTGPLEPGGATGVVSCHGSKYYHGIAQEQLSCTDPGLQPHDNLSDVCSPGGSDLSSASERVGDSFSGSKVSGFGSGMTEPASAESAEEDSKETSCHRNLVLVQRIPEVLETKPDRVKIKEEAEFQVECQKDNGVQTLQLGVVSPDEPVNPLKERSVTLPQNSGSSVGEIPRELKEDESTKYEIIPSARASARSGKKRGRPRKLDTELRISSKSNMSEAVGKQKSEKQSRQKKPKGKELHESVDEGLDKESIHQDLIKLHRCEHCGKTFSDRGTLTRHIRIHTGERPYSCPFCGVAFSDSSTRNQHVRRHTGQKPYKCGTCGKAFAGSNDLKKHERVHSGEKRYLCDVCGKGFTTSVNLSSHLQVHVKVKSFPCTLCKKSFSTASSLQLHTNIHTGERPYKCHTCDCSFRQQAKLYNHQKLHIKTEASEEKPFVCKICNRGCRTEFHLTMHMNVHSENFKNKCTLCAQSFRRLSELENHFVVHTGTKEHACGLCGLEFAHIASLKAHYKCHKKKREFECRLCEIKFPQRYLLKDHMVIHNTNNMFECGICSKGFTSGFMLDRHRRIHTGKKEFKCDVCGKQFIQRVSMQIHMRLHSGEKPYECSLCQKRFTQSPNWKTHMVNQHGFDRETLRKKRVVLIPNKAC